MAAACTHSRRLKSSLRGDCWNSEKVVASRDADSWNEGFALVHSSTSLDATTFPSFQQSPLSADFCGQLFTATTREGTTY